jgi:HYDIN/CFA65/VesB-like, Ig-like domain
MKLRSQHIALLAVLAVAGLVALPVLWSLLPGTVPESEDAFLEKIRAQRELGLGSNSEEGSVRGTPGKLVTEADEVDLGLVPNDRHTKRDFKLFNKGDGPLEIIHIESSCPKCTKVSIAERDRLIPPGGQAVIRVEFQPEGVPGFHSEKILLIQSNDPVNTILKIPIKADIDPEFAVEPTEVEFGTVEKGVPTEQKVRIRQLGDSPFQVTDVTTPGDRNACEVEWAPVPESERSDPNRAEYEVTVRPLPEVRPGKFLDRVRIASTCSRVPALDIRVSGDVHAFYSVEPEMLTLRKAAKPGTKDATTATIRADEPFEVTDVSLDNSELSAEARPGDGPNTVLLALSVPETATAGFKKGVLSFDVVAGDRKVRHTMRVFATVKK